MANNNKDDSIIPQKKEVTIGCQVEEITTLTPNDQFNDTNIHITYCGKTSSEVVEVQLLKDYESSTKFGLKVKPLIKFAHRNNGMIRDELVNAFSKNGVDRMNDLQYALYRLLFPQYISPYNKSDIVVLSPTGSGKTFAYMIPILQYLLQKGSSRNRKPSVLIFCYTNALVDATNKILLNLIGDLDIQVVTTLDKDIIHHNDYDIGIFTFKGFEKYYSSSLFGLEVVEFLIIDEADLIMEDIKASRYFCELKKYSTARVMQLSATGNGYMRELMDEKNMFAVVCGDLNTISPTVIPTFYEVNSKVASVITGFSKGKIEIGEYPQICCPIDKLYQLIQKIITESNDKILIFVKRKDIAAVISHRLALLGISSVVMKNDYMAKDKELIFDAFKQGKFNVLVGTRMLSRGIDFNIDHVVSYDLPESYVELIHRCGRVGRNGKIGQAHIFMDFSNSRDYNPGVIQILIQKIYNMLVNQMIEYERLPRPIQMAVHRMSAEATEQANQAADSTGSVPEIQNS